MKKYAVAFSFLAIISAGLFLTAWTPIDIRAIGGVPVTTATPQFKGYVPADIRAWAGQPINSTPTPYYTPTPGGILLYPALDPNAAINPATGVPQLYTGFPGQFYSFNYLGQNAYFGPVTTIGSILHAYYLGGSQGEGLATHGDLDITTLDDRVFINQIGHVWTFRSTDDAGGDVDNVLNGPTSFGINIKATVVAQSFSIQPSETPTQLVMIPIKTENLSPTPTVITVYVVGHQ